MQWISTEEALPDVHQDVLLWNDTAREVRVGWRAEAHEWATWSECIDHVSHWMPLPTPPKTQDARPVSIAP